MFSCIQRYINPIHPTKFIIIVSNYVQDYLVFGFDFDFGLHKLTFSYGRSRAQLAPTEEDVSIYIK